MSARDPRRWHPLAAVAAAVALAVCSPGCGCSPPPSGLASGDVTTRAQAAEEAGRIRDKTQLPALRAALRDPAWNVRIAAAWSLGEIGDTSDHPRLKDLHAWEKAHVVDKVAALHALAKLGDAEARTALLGMLESPDASVRTLASGALARPGDAAALPHLVDLAADPDVEVRAAAAVGLGRLRLPDALPRLTALLEDKQAKVRAGAAEGLGYSGLPGAAAAIVAALPKLEAFELPKAAEALGRLGDPEQIVALEGLCGERTAAVRLAAVRALGAFDSDRARKVAGTLQNDPDPEVRAAAAQVAGIAK